MLKFKPLTADEVTFTITIEDEDIDPSGHFASGEDDLDALMVKEIRDRLNRGDLWAWCCVKVTATWKGWRASDYLGACSYENVKDFKTEGGYYADMCSRALEELNADLEKNFSELAERAG